MKTNIIENDKNMMTRIQHLNVSKAWKKTLNEIKKSIRRFLIIVFSITCMSCASVPVDNLYFAANVVNETDYTFDRLFVFLGDDQTMLTKNVPPRRAYDKKNEVYGGGGYRTSTFKGAFKFQWSRGDEPLKVIEFHSRDLPVIDKRTARVVFSVHDRKIVVTQSTYDAGSFPDIFATGTYVRPKTTTKQIFEKSL